MTETETEIETETHVRDTVQIHISERLVDAFWGQRQGQRCTDTHHHSRQRKQHTQAYGEALTVWRQIFLFLCFPAGLRPVTVLLVLTLLLLVLVFVLLVFLVFLSRLFRRLFPQQTYTNKKNNKKTATPDVTALRTAATHPQPP